MSAIDDFKALCQAKPVTATVAINDNGVGRNMIVRGMKAGERMKLVEACQDKDGRDSLIEIVRLSLCDESGDLIIKTDEDAAMLAEWHVGWVKTLADAALKLNGVQVDDGDPEGN